MKINNSKKQLARLISENGGWRGNANWAAQDKNGIGMYAGGRPYWDLGYKEWASNAEDGYCTFVINGCNVVSDYHQTAISREEFHHLYPAPDADGWIEWLRDELPVEEGVIIDVKYSDGDELHSAPCGVFTTNMTSIRGELASAECFGRGDGSFVHIIAYRLHKPEQAKPDYCESVTRSIPEPSDKPTIEQLAADYRNAKDYANHKQQEADAAKADADSKLAELVAAGKALGLVLSVAGAESELVITDWRDLMAGDIVEVSGSKNENWLRFKGVELLVSRTGTTERGLVFRTHDGDEWCHGGNTHWRFIRRPAR